MSKAQRTSRIHGSQETQEIWGIMQKKNTAITWAHIPLFDAITRMLAQ